MVKIVRFHELGNAEVLRIEDFPLAEPQEGERSSYTSKSNRTKSSRGGFSSGSIFRTATVTRSYRL